jgi:hypothetical protein
MLWGFLLNNFLRYWRGVERTGKMSSISDHLRMAYPTIILACLTPIPTNTINVHFCQPNPYFCLVNPDTCLHNPDPCLMPTLLSVLPNLTPILAYITFISISFTQILAPIPAYPTLIFVQPTSVLVTSPLLFS